MTKISIEPHPEEILDLDEETIAIGRAKLAGIDFTEIYGDEDRTSPEMMIRIQAQRIRDLFQTIEELKQSFSSPQKIQQAHKDMMIDEIDLEFVLSYCKQKQFSFVSDAEALQLVGFGRDTVEERHI